MLIIGLILISLLWANSRQAELEERKVETKVTGEQVKLRLEACVQSRVDLVNILAEQGWQNSQELESNWRNRASIVFPILPGIQALNFVDTNWTIQRVYPLEPNFGALGKDLTQNINPSVLASLPLAEASDDIVRTNIIDLLQSGKGFVLYKKIVNAAGENLGYVNGVFRVDDLMESCLAEADLRKNFQFMVTELDGTPVYSRADTSGPWSGEVRLEVEIADRPWYLIFAPTESFVSSQNNRFVDVLVLLATLLVFAVFFATRMVVRHQAILKQSQENYRVLVENQSDMVVKLNLQGKFTYVSPSYCEFFEKSETELLNHQFTPQLHDDDREVTEASMASLSRAPHVSYHEQRVMTKDGWRWLAWSNKGVLNAQGELEAITAVGRDVTEVKALEDRIAHTDKMKALGELAGGISHDFNNLLQVMLGNLEFLIDQTDDRNNAAPLLVRVRNAVQRAMQLTQKLAGLSRQNAAQRQIIDLNHLTADLMDLMERTIPESIKLALDSSATPLLVKADPSQIEQVVLNLCFNARDAIEQEGEIRLQLSQVDLDADFCRQHPLVHPGEYIKFTVSDNGKGIDEKSLPRIFDPFFTTKEPGVGTGLGLANCFNIIQQHNGMMTVDSHQGQGSTFSVFLPELPTNNIVEGVPGRDPGTDKNNSTRKVELVLVADDNDEVRRLVCAQLNQSGYQTLEAVDGFDAVEKFLQASAQICLVVLDVVMPRMGGQVAATEILKHKPGTPLLFISGYSPEVSGYGELPGPILKKPFKSEQLKRLVKECLA